MHPVTAAKTNFPCAFAKRSSRVRSLRNRVPYRSSPTSKEGERFRLCNDCNPRNGLRLNTAWECRGGGELRRYVGEVHRKVRFPLRSPLAESNQRWCRVLPDCRTNS